MKIVASEEQLKQIGVYCIQNLISGKRYIGSTIQSFYVRWRWHQWALNQGNHHSIYLQHAWNKYGNDAFEVSVLVVADRDSVLMEEQKYIDLHQASIREYGYNILPNARSRIGHRHTEESKKKMSVSLSGKRRQPLSEEHKKKIADSCRGKKMTPEQCKKSGDAKRGKPLSELLRMKLSIAHRGKRLSAEHKKKISDGLKRRSGRVAKSEPKHSRQMKMWID